MPQSINVAVIGGGAGGLVVPLGLQGTGARCDVFEARSELGGNIRTRVLEGHVVETGAEFVGKRKSYETTWALCDIVGIVPKAFKLSSQVINHNNGVNVTLPPVLVTAENDGNCCSCMGIFSSTKQKGVRVDFHSIFNHLIDEIEMGFIASFGSSLPSEATRTVTLNEACELFINRPVPLLKIEAPDLLKQKRREFINNILLGMIAAPYGKKISGIRTFGCHESFNYLTLDNLWYEIEEGWMTLFQKVMALCKDATFHTNHPVKKVIKVPAQGDNPLRYIIQLEDGNFVMDPETKRPKLYDEVVYATPLNVTRKILPDEAENQQLVRALTPVTYYPTSVVYSRSPKYQSTTGAVCRVDIHGDLAIFSVCKEFKFKEDIEKGLQPIVKTWCYEGYEPENIIHKEDFWHLDLDDNFRTAQIAIMRSQGQNGQHYSGTAASYNDSNNAACRSGIAAAFRIAHKHKLLKLSTYLPIFMEKGKLRPEDIDQLTTFPTVDADAAPAAAAAAI
jgi:predicted NAD/FAD-binding protein